MNTLKGQIQRFKNKLDKHKTKIKKNRNSFNYSLSNKMWCDNQTMELQGINYITSFYFLQILPIIIIKKII